MTPAVPENVSFVEGVAFWAPQVPDWEAAQALFRGHPMALPESTGAPFTELLAPAERRRAPPTVKMALHVAAQAVRMSGLEARSLSSVFTSAHGDLSVTDAICDVLAHAPDQLSPTKFHHSVHNAAAGYWSIATGAQPANTALSAKEFSFAVGLLEALCQSTASSRPVLLVGYDIEATGPLASVNTSRGMLAIAVVISPAETARSRHALEWMVRETPTAPRAHASAAIGAGLTGNGMSDALPFVEAMCGAMPADVSLPISSGVSIALRLRDAPQRRMT